MAAASSLKGPNVSIKSHIMGVGKVTELSATEAIIYSDVFDDWILVTPKDTFYDQTVDLTKKLTLHMDVVYKANRTSKDPNNYTSALAVYVRPLKSCMCGRARIRDLKPTFAFAESPECGEIFFMATAVKEPVMYLPVFHKRRDMSMWLRVGDWINFVAVRDESTKSRSSYAIDVYTAFNENPAKRMIGVVTAVRDTNCDVWAKNLHPLVLNNEELGVDPELDLRDVLTEGDRITFRRAMNSEQQRIRSVRSVALGSGGGDDDESSSSCSDSEEPVPTNGEDGGDPIRRYQWPNAAHVENGISATRSSTYADDSEAWPRLQQSVIPNHWGNNCQFVHNAVAEGSVHSLQQQRDEQAVLRELEDELAELVVRIEGDNCGGGATATNSTINDANSDQPNDNDNDEIVISASHPPIAGAVTPASNRDGDCSAKKHTADAEVQVSNMPEFEIMKILLDDVDIFSIICQRYPQHLKPLLQSRRNW